jgi:hypothetical protein
VDLAKECAIGTPRVTATVVDPDNPHIVWAGVEIDGVHRSLDGGDTWGRMAGGLADPDIHGMVIARGNPTRVLTSTPREIFASTDVGESWQRMHIAQQFPAPYSRWIAVKPDDPQVIFAACGDSAIGSSGNLQRTTDGGQSWHTLPLPVEPNSPLYGFTVNAANPERLLSYSLFSGWNCSRNCRACAAIACPSRACNSCHISMTVKRMPLGHPGSFQSSHVQRARPMISSWSRADSHGSSSVKSVTHCRQEQGMRVMSVPQNMRSGPKAS